VDGVVAEDEAEAGLVGSDIVDGELERVVELAPQRFWRVGDVHGLQDREGVEEIDGLLGHDRGGRFQIVQLSELAGAVGFEGVEAAAEPVAEGAVGGLQFFDEPVLPSGQVGDLVPQRRGSSCVGLLSLVGCAGEATPEVGVPVGAEDAGGDDVAEGFDEGVFADVDGLRVVGRVAVEAVGVVVGRVTVVVRPTVTGLTEHALVAHSTSDARA
jgi:hypothetical protein